MIKTQNLLQNAIDDLGLEVYNYYKDEKHSFVVEILTGIAGSIIFEYLKGIINFEKLGVITKNKLTPLFNSFDEKNETEKTNLINEAVQTINDNPDIIDFTNETQLVQAVKKYLVSINFPDKIADEKAKMICMNLKKEMKK